MVAPLGLSDMPRRPCGDPSGPTRLSLLLRVCQGEQDAWEEFYHLYGPVIVKAAQVRGLDQNDADDVLVEVMSSLVQGMRRGFEVNHSKGLFRSYLKTITARAISGALRKRHRELSVSGLEAADAPRDEVFDKFARQERVLLAWQRVRNSGAFRTRDLDAFEHFVMKGQTAKTVAGRFGLTADRVYRLKREMIAKLREAIVKLDRELGEV